MIIHLILVVIIISFTEIYRYFNLKNLIKDILQTNKKIFKLFFFSKNSSETWKEKEVIKLSKKLLFSSFKLFLLVAFMIFIIILAGNYDKNFYNFFLEFNGLIETTIIFLIYYFIKKIINAKL